MKRLLILLAALLINTAYTSPVTQVADANATVRNTGPTSSPWFHNAQVPGTFESYGISTFSFSAADFSLAAVTDIASVEVSYMQSNAGFTTDGPLDFFISFDPTVAGGDFSGLIHNSVGAGIDDAQFSDSPSLQSIGSGTFTEVSTGTVDTYTLTFSGTQKSNLIQAINNGNPFAILMGASSGSTAATYAGIESNNYVINGGSIPDANRTSLSIEAIPEADTLWLLLVGAAGLKWVRMRKKR